VVSLPTPFPKSPLSSTLRFNNQTPKIRMPFRARRLGIEDVTDNCSFLDDG
jgi:hypothetical protein